MTIKMVLAFVFWMQIIIGFAVMYDWKGEINKLRVGLLVCILGIIALMTTLDGLVAGALVAISCAIGYIFTGDALDLFN